MREDKLNIDIFTDQNGHNYRQAVDLDLVAVEKYFVDLGYIVFDLHQLWRHVHGKLQKSGQTYFLKLASTLDIGIRTKNEVAWNQQLGEKIKTAGVDYFTVPQVYETGEYEGKFYFISSYYGGNLLVDNNPFDISSLEVWLDKVVLINLFLLFLPVNDFNLPRDNEDILAGEKIERFHKKVETWCNDVREYDLEVLLLEIKKLDENCTISVNHSDFVPWHMIIENDKFVLIDGEHGTAKSLKYYDVCYFYHRLYTAARAPQLAKLYLSKIVKALSVDEQDNFLSLMRPVLASRIIGGFWDEKTAGRTDVKYHQMLKQDFLSNHLF
jgi:hypothetical protein